MNRLFIGLGAAACLGFTGAASAANGSVAGNMPRDHWNASARIAQAQAKAALVAKNDVAETIPAAPSAAAIRETRSAEPTVRPRPRSR